MSPPLVFAGPSLPGPLPAGFAFRPPAAAGDLLALIAAPPPTVVLIDGVFDARPAVQHKEILELLARGTRVIGGASMGALRAAELHHGGMEGHGAVFAAFASGRLTADDEVAVLHAPAALGYRCLSDALVDIRATLAAAATQRIIPTTLARRLRALAASTFWRDRCWPALIDAATGIDRGAAARLAAWLPRGRVGLKTRDARLCLAAALRPRRAAITPDPPPRTHFFMGLAAIHGVALDDPGG